MMGLRCREVPQLPGLGEIRLRAGAAGSERLVRWPYVAENRSFSPWIKGGELVFITGIGRHHNQGNLFELLYEAARTEIAGLVILTGDVYIGQLPLALLRLADQLQMPLLEQPYSLPMVTVTEAISRAIVQREQQARRLTEQRAGSLLERLQLRVGEPEERLALIEPFIGQHLELLKQLASSLEAWLAHQGNLTAAADALGCHRNSLRYRLDKLFTLTGLEPGNIDDIYTLTLALALLREPASPRLNLETPHDPAS